MTSDLPVLLFGLEHSIWEETDDAEKRQYALATRLFFILAACMMLAGGVLLYMITSNEWLILPGAALFVFVAGSILRFSLIIMRRSVYPEKKKVTEVTDKKGKLLQRLHFNFPSLTTGFGYVIRAAILTSITFLCIFPVAALVEFKEVRELNLLQNKKYVEAQVSVITANYQNKIHPLEQSLSACNQYISDNTGHVESGKFLSYKMEERDRLEHDIATLRQRCMNDIERVKKEKNDSKKSRFFLVTTFKFLVNRFSFMLISVLLLGMVIYAHLILHRLKTDQKFTYSTISTDYYRSLISSDYNQGLAYRKALLYDRYGIITHEFHEEKYWHDAPYCTESKHIKHNRKYLPLKLFIKEGLKR